MKKNTLLLLGVAAIAVYYFMRKKKATELPPSTILDAQPAPVLPLAPKKVDTSTILVKGSNVQPVAMLESGGYKPAQQATDLQELFVKGTSGQFEALSGIGKIPTVF